MPILVSLLLIFLTSTAWGQSKKPLYSKTVYFEFGKWDLRPQDDKTLQAVVKAIKAQKGPYRIALTGHTDNVDNDRYNYELGLKRARTVAQYLIKRGADSLSITLESKGENAKKNDNTTDSMRMLNRRVDILLFAAEQPAQQSIEPHTAKPIKMVVQLIDSITGEPLKGQLMATEISPGSLAKVGTICTETSICVVDVRDGEYYEVSFAAKGYRSKNMTYRIGQTVVATSDTIRIEESLTKAKIKRKVSFEKIYFYGNEDRFLPTSGGELRKLLMLAKSKDASAIEIIGHVNYPYHMNQNDTQMMKFNYSLSFRRAKAVYNYLVENGVNRSIITYKGVSNTEMKFPMATREDEMQQNRRVEVLVLEE